MDASPLMEHATTHRLAGRFQEAEVIYRQLLTADANNAAAWHGLGLIALAAGHRDAAVTCLRRAVSLQPANTVFQEELRRCETPTNSLEATSLNNAGIAHAKSER